MEYLKNSDDLKVLDDLTELNDSKDMSAPFLPIANYKPEIVFKDIPTPAYIIDECKLKQNGKILKSVAISTNAKILLAQKAFSNFYFYPLLEEYLNGTEASGLYEARLGKEEMTKKEVHVFSAAYREDEFNELLNYADHIVFNSISQLKKYGKLAKQNNKSLGIRVNPECSTQEGHAIYDPCASGSRLGVTRGAWDKEMDVDTFKLLDGLHFHTLCEQNSDDLEKTLRGVDDKFGDILPKLKWLNMGGGHHITRDDYNVKTLEKCIKFAQDKWGVQVYLEPGEAVALNSGFLISRVLDIVENNGTKIAITDSSAACHMPDVIEMPYTPPLYNATQEETENNKFKYRLAGPTCLAGDIIGDYYFKNELRVGELLVFGDMAIYTTCKNNTFNGMPLPNIWARKCNGDFEKLTSFGYDNFKARLG